MRITKSPARLLSILTLTALGTGATALFGGQDFIAKGTLASAECYRMPASESPVATEDEYPDAEVWCYKELETPVGSRVIYNLDSKGRARPELTLIIEADGTMRHASLHAGKLTFHRLRADFNPIGVPLTPPANAERVPEPISASSTDSIDTKLKLFQEFGQVDLKIAKVEEGQFDVSVPPEAMPWRGYWYPYSSARLHRGEESTLAKLDKFIARRAADTNPGAQAWERRRHGYHGVGWSGHCNGWAAASVLVPEPRTPIHDPYSGVTFSVSDLKGLLIERHYCPKIVFYGSRNYERPEDNPRDIHPRTFHNVLTYFLNDLKKPVLMDYMASRPVENSVVSGYSMKVKKLGPNRFYVETTAKIHHYDKDLNEELGEATSKLRTYKYTLTTNDEGLAVSGAWISSNPDFLWIPLAPAECKVQNEVVEQLWIDEINRFAVNPTPATP